MFLNRVLLPPIQSLIKSRAWPCGKEIISAHLSDNPCLSGTENFKHMNEFYLAQLSR
jgi:hypothetical protein